MISSRRLLPVVLAIVAEKRVVAVLTTIAEDDIPNISHEFGTKVMGYCKYSPAQQHHELRVRILLYVYLKY
ncbi:hypothetical protein F2Q69_00015807 [Brassica cretica]|uniref:N-acetyltransferase domain-containing protein n=1 Tax=Brassica cretica TaxID=69181 RepID=A0A8S9R4F6_BRACR|nr:hypothetical protein F2Q69_00015807 [Brassica cretica]